jgi:ParB family chromosome partitioning protein
MARKDLLKGLMDDSAKPPARPNDTSGDHARVDAVRPRYQKGAIGAVSQSIAELKSRSLTDIDPHMIEAGGIEDRLEYDEGEHAALMESMRNYGQQVPILVRPSPQDSTRYQIVYGRRRVLAARDLGIPIRAMIRDLDDQDLILAQGQENTARRDLSFIEKVNFASQMRDAGYARNLICDALHVDKTTLSRMIQVADAVPSQVIVAIGSAHGVGRPRWLKLGELLRASDMETEGAVAIAQLPTNGPTSQDRFEGLMNALLDATRLPKHPAPAPTRLTGADDTPLATVRHKGKKIAFDFDTAEGARFAEWLTEQLPEIHQTWKTRDDE